MKEGLMDRLRVAVEIGEVGKRFTKEDVKKWVEDNGIKKSNGRSYARHSIKSILYSSDKANTGALNKKVLESERVGRKLVYRFIEGLS